MHELKRCQRFDPKKLFLRIFLDTSRIPSKTYPTPLTQSVILISSCVNVPSDTTTQLITLVLQGNMWHALRTATPTDPKEVRRHARELKIDFCAHIGSVSCSVQSAALRRRGTWIFYFGYSFMFFYEIVDIPPKSERIWWTFYLTNRVCPFASQPILH
jgi:hypothetical protein